MLTVASLPSFDNLKRQVHETLCAHDRLDPAQTPLKQSIIIRRKRPCGLFFQAQGPRMLKTYAVWSSDEHRVLFYDSTGERIREYRLSEAPDATTLDCAA